MEMGAASITVEKFAEIRARRLLLNENPWEEGTAAKSAVDTANDALNESLIRGISSIIKVTQSDFPRLFEEFGNSPKFFLEAAWIKAAADLRLSAAVERIERLSLTLEGTTLSVDFIGHRHRKYVNVEPHVIAITGTQRLKP
jgi:hypothetical protein